MNQQYYIVSALAGMAIIGAFVFTHVPEENPDVELQDITNNYDARENLTIMGGGGGTSWRTTHVPDIADDISHTIRGTVLSVGEPIHWAEREIAPLGHAAFPVTMSVDEIYKGTWNSTTFTVYDHMFYYTLDDDGNHDLAFINITATLHDPNKVYLKLPERPRYDIGKELIIHTQPDNVMIENYHAIDDVEYLEEFLPFYITPLGVYSTYTIRDNIAYDHYDRVISIDVISTEAQ